VILPGTDPLPVWPHKDGTVRGMSFYPLYPSVPEAAGRNPALWRTAGAVRCGARRQRPRTRAGDRSARKALAGMNANDPERRRCWRWSPNVLGDDLRDEMVFVGGAVAGLLITDPAMPAIRPTEDVDLLCQCRGACRLPPRRDGLAHKRLCAGHAPAGADLSVAASLRWWSTSCRSLVKRCSALPICWYPLALETARWDCDAAQRSSDPPAYAAPVFLATKLEAFDGRGQGDFLFSHDLGDLLAVVDGQRRCIAGRVPVPVRSGLLKAYLG
jgi:hypothetical protein